MTPLRFRCSSCDAPLKVAANAAGKTFPCPKCGTAVTVPKAETAREPRPGEIETLEHVPEDSAEHEALTEPKPRRKKRRRPEPPDDASAWRKVRLGATLSLIAVALGLLSMLLGWLLPFVFSGGGLLTTVRFSLIFGAVRSGLALIGVILFAFTPRSHAPRTLIYVCIGLLAFTQLCGVGMMAWAFRAVPDAPATAEEFEEQVRKQVEEDRGKSAEERLEDTRRRTEEMLERTSGVDRILFWSRILMLVSSVYAVLFPLFLGELARSLKRNDLANLCETIIKWTVIAIGMSLVPLLILQIGGLPGLLAMPLGFLMFGGALISLAVSVMFILLYVGLREATEPLARTRPRRKKPRPE